MLSTRRRLTSPALLRREPVMTTVANHTEVSIQSPLPLEIGAQIEALTPDGCTVGLYLGSHRSSMLLATADGELVEVPNGVSVTVRTAADPVTLMLVRALADEAIRRRDDRDSHEAWKARLVVVAHEEADNRDWCSDFDDLMDDLGLPRRVRDYDLEVRFCGVLSVTVSASCEDDASSQVDAELVAERLRELLDCDGFTPDITSID